MRDTDEICNTVQKDATIQGCNTTIQRQNNAESKMRTVREREGERFDVFASYQGTILQELLYYENISKRR